MKYICGHQGKISRTCGWNILVNFCCLLSRLLSKHPQPTAMRRHLPLISTTQVPASGFKHEYQHFTVIITMRSTQHACGWAWGVWEQGYLGSKCLCFTSDLAWRCSIHQHEIWNWCIRTTGQGVFFLKDSHEISFRQNCQMETLQWKTLSNSAKMIRWGREGFLVKLSQKKRQRDVT